MLTWDGYAERFDKFVRDGRYSASSIKTLRYIFNRLRRQLDVEDLFDAARLLRYRRQLPSTVVGNVDAVLRFLRELDDDPKVPLPVRRPLRANPHPLFADVMALGAIFGNDRLPDMTWSDLKKLPPHEEGAYSHARRVWDWWMGTDTTPTEISPLVPASGHGKAIRVWEAEAIINSSVEPDRKIGLNAAFEPMVQTIGVLVLTDAPADMLRSVCTSMALLGRHAEDQNWADVKRLIAHAETTRDPLGVAYWAFGLPRDAKVNPELLW